LANVSVARSQHKRTFYHAADWLVAKQDAKSGGWPTSVAFNANHFKYSLAEEMEAGWISAMGSAHAMSVLTRAYRDSRNEVYLKAAVRAMHPFSVPSSEGGVLAMFMGQHVWYEEYPTKPSSFVLNGFMYALLGLYDLQQTLVEFKNLDEAAEAEGLFSRGLSSLVSLVSLFDTGAGSTYDLRHVSMGGAPKLARWDYHSTHVNLLLVLSSVAPEAEQKSYLLEVAARWQSYMLGERAGHN
jgi:heparosan-N-sulfate-glucuronate 5-epimerase